MWYILQFNGFWSLLLSAQTRTFIYQEKNNLAQGWLETLSTILHLIQIWEKYHVDMFSVDLILPTTWTCVNWVLDVFSCGTSSPQYQFLISNENENILFIKCWNWESFHTFDFILLLLQIRCKNAHFEFDGCWKVL